MRNNMQNNMQNDGNLLVQFVQCQKRLKKFNMHIHVWSTSTIAVYRDTHGQQEYLLNNVKDIRTLSGFIDGLETAQKLQERIDEGNKNAEN
jgi:hypothetical protein